MAGGVEFGCFGVVDERVKVVLRTLTGKLFFDD